MLKHLSGFLQLRSEWNQGAAPPPLFRLANPHFHPPPPLPLCPTMSHSLVTYLVPAYLESQHRVQFQELGNSWPVTRLECIRIRAFHTLFRYTYARASSCVYEEWKDQCRVQISRDDFTIISEQIRVFITFFRREIGENRGEGILNLG